MSTSSSMTRIRPLVPFGFISCDQSRWGRASRVRPRRACGREGNSSWNVVPCRHAAVHLDRAAMLLDDTVRYRQPEAGALAADLGREERIVDAGQVLRRDALTGILRPRLESAESPTRVRSVSTPPPSIASRAFRTRFRKTCCSLPALPRITGRSGSEVHDDADLSALRSDARTSETVSSTTWLMSISVELDR